MVILAEETEHPFTRRRIYIALRDRALATATMRHNTLSSHTFQSFFNQSLQRVGGPSGFEHSHELLALALGEESDGRLHSASDWPS